MHDLRRHPSQRRGAVAELPQVQWRSAASSSFDSSERWVTRQIGSRSSTMRRVVLVVGTTG